MKWNSTSIGLSLIWWKKNNFTILTHKHFSSIQQSFRSTKFWFSYRNIVIVLMMRRCCQLGLYYSCCDIAYNESWLTDRISASPHSGVDSVSAECSLLILVWFEVITLGWFVLYSDLSLEFSQKGILKLPKKTNKNFNLN